MKLFSLIDELELFSKGNDNYAVTYAGYISHIRFPRYKNIADGTRVDFTFPVTALVGSNGSGKTSVLNALFGAPARYSTGQYWFSTKVDPIDEGDGSPSRFIYGHYNRSLKGIVETRKARVKKVRNGRPDPNYWEPTKETSGDEMIDPVLVANKRYEGRSKDRWNPVSRKVVYINFRKELSAFDKYFYFGKDPALHANSQKGANGKSRVRRIASKMDQVRYDANWLAKVISSNDTTVNYRGRKIATENRLLTDDELQIVSFILGREYIEARWIRHRLFKGDAGLSIIFKTRHGRYSEAFAGSGEVAVTSCVVQILQAKRGSLVLLDEPEVSLHPGAQERLLAFLLNKSRTLRLQIVFSTHSPHLVTSLPECAIKTFHQLSDGRFTIIPSTHPYAAFQRLEMSGGKKVRIIVEDRLAKFVVEQALLMIQDQAVKDIFTVDFLSGGATAILKYQIPVLMSSPGHTLILLDGDQRHIVDFEDPQMIPLAENHKLAGKLKEATGLDPEFSIDGGELGGNQTQLHELQRQYLGWIKKNLAYIPTSCPEELVLRVAGKKVPDNSNSQAYKDAFYEVVKEVYRKEVSNERVDIYGETLLAMNRDNSTELKYLADQIVDYLRKLSLQQ